MTVNMDAPSHDSYGTIPSFFYLKKDVCGIEVLGNTNTLAAGWIYMNIGREEKREKRERNL